MKGYNNLTTGVDIVKIERIRRILRKDRARFYKKVFTEKEIEYISNKGNRAETVAGIFAAKEAISKVLGTGIGSIGWKDIEILHDNNKPYVNISERVKRRMDEIKISDIEISISHERDYAIANAIGYSSLDRLMLANLKIDESMKSLLPKRKLNSHKGTYGRVAIIGGSTGMTGAPYLSSLAALRTGAGLVYTIVPKSLEPVMSIKLTEAIIRPVEDKGKGTFTRHSLGPILEALENIDVVALGPGMGVDEDRIHIVEEIIKNFKGPIVIDADGINCISLKPEILIGHNRQIIITPHPGELARLAMKDVKEIQDNRIFYSNYISNKYNIIVVLKGFNTIVAYHKDRVYVNETGNPGMATAGSGDVLTGIIAGFLAQGLSPFDSGKLGVYCHGLAGDIGSLDKGECGLIATDIIDNIPYSIKIVQL
ncbi:MAG: NAD(P)H-hydrate dehydratase [Tissierellia bacterium]|nr:NAD(P)H-hydrate dehydratase [Tissierellia bacterium]